MLESKAMPIPPSQMPLEKAMEQTLSEFPACVRHRQNQLKSKPLKLTPFPAPLTKLFLKQKKISSPPPPYRESDPPRQNLIVEVFTTQATTESAEQFTKKTLHP
jgi:hypothetical protein